jgi:DNA-binding NtrC family response regulator
MADVVPSELPSPARMLLVDSERGLGERLGAAIVGEFAIPPVVVEVTGGRAAIELCRGAEFDLVLAGLEALADIAERVDDRLGRLARAASGALVLVLSRDQSISLALGAMRAGAHDCIDGTIEALSLVRRIGELAKRHGKARLVTRSAQVVRLTPVVDSAAAGGPSIPVMRDLVLPMWRQEQKIIEDAIQSFAGNIAMAAAALELSPSTIYRKRQAWAEMDSRRGDLASVSAG